MARNVDIFIGTRIPLPEFVASLGRVLDLSFTKVMDDDMVSYQHNDTRLSVFVCLHELENDRDLDFERYPVQVSIRSLDFADTLAQETKSLEVASQFYSTLQQTNRYPLMLVDDLQRCIKRYVPHQSTAGS